MVERLTVGWVVTLGVPLSPGSPSGPPGSPAITMSLAIGSVESAQTTPSGLSLLTLPLSL